MKEVVWIMGTSAAGKETFIRRITSDPELAGSLGWSGLVVPSEASLKYIKQSPDDPIAEKREEILMEVPRLLKMANVVVNKWQFVDTENRRPERLQALAPEAGHTAIVLEADPDDLMQNRLPRKPWWGEFGYDTWVSDELPLVTEAVEALPEEFRVVHLHSGGPNNYQPLAVPATSVSDR